MTYAFVKHLYGGEVVDPLFNVIEYAPHTDPDWDPFSVVHDVSYGSYPHAQEEFQDVADTRSRCRAPTRICP